MTQPADDTWAILLAAGESTRMGRPKQLLEWGGVTLVEWQVARLLEAGADGVAVVIGSRGDEIEPAVLRAGALPVLNRDYRQGRASSVRAGARAIERPPARLVILSVDQPRPAWVTRRLLAVASEPPAKILSPRYQGHGGHPLVLDGSLLEEVRAVDEATLGLRAVVQRHQAESAYLEFENSCVIVDLNTPAEYESALAAFQRGEWDEDFTS